MRCEKDSCLFRNINFIDSFSKFLFRYNIKSNRWLIKENNFGLMNQTSHNFTSHSLSERKLSNWRIYELSNLKFINQIIDSFYKIRLFYIKQLCHYFECIHRRQMISQSRSLPKNSPYHVNEFFPLCTWIESDHRHTTRSRMKNPGKHLYCSRFTSTVWPEEGNLFSFLHRKIYTRYGYNFFVCWFK